jgi:hypothetical protein
MNHLRYGITLFLVLTGCGLGDAGSPSLRASAAPGAPDASAGPGDCVEPACQDVPLGTSAHAVRLTSSQWERTVRDLLKLSALPGNSVTFPPDPVASADRFGSEAGDLIVTTQHWAAYQKAAEALADLVVGDANALDALVPAGAKAGELTARVTAFVDDFLPRAYRRAVTPQESAAVIAAAEIAAGTVDAADPFSVRVKWILTTVLQSPKFVYRISFGDGDGTDHRVNLSGYERASKLAYALWGTMPDASLMDLAKQGKLTTKEGVAEIARQMLQDPRAEVALADFHDELYLVSHYVEVKNRPLDAFPNFYDDFGLDAQQDIRRTVQELIVKQNGGLKELQTSTVAFVNQRLAKVYDVDPANIPELASAGPDVFAKIEMDGTRRKGILMHPGWLTYQASPKDPSPIRRGAYVARHVLCSPLGSPPAGAAGADPNKAPGATNRLRVTATTKGCGDGCHGGKSGLINPLGFSFEGFDSIGQIRLMDHDVAVDTKDETALTGAFDGAVGLFDTVSKSSRAHACYAAHWAAYLNGTSLVDATQRALSPAVAKSMQNGSVRDILVELVQTDAFLTVSR